MRCRITDWDACIGYGSRGDRQRPGRFRLRWIRREADSALPHYAACEWGSAGRPTQLPQRHRPARCPDQCDGDPQPKAASLRRALPLSDPSGDPGDLREQQLPVSPGQAGHSEPTRDPTRSGRRKLEPNSVGSQGACASLTEHLLGGSRPDPGRHCDQPEADRCPSPTEGQPLLPESRHSQIQASGRLHSATACHSSDPRRGGGRPLLEPSALLDLPEGAR
jgi:hypothetical protein